MEDLNTEGVEHLTQAMGGPPASRSSIGPWTLLGWHRTDSTNSRALKALGSANRHALDHMAVFAELQTEGRGQQHRPWSHEGGRDLAMTLILSRRMPSHTPFALNLAISLAVIEGIEDALPGIGGAALEIKWPNDIMWHGLKAGGILIENSWRGRDWASAVIGIGLNVGGSPPYPNATRLLDRTTASMDVLPQLRASILLRADARLSETNHPESLLRQYHERLHGWGRAQRWQLDGAPVRGILESIDIEGRLCVSIDGRQQCFSPGEVGWLGMEPDTPSA